MYNTLSIASCASKVHIRTLCDIYDGSKFNMWMCRYPTMAICQWVKGLLKIHQPSLKLLLL